MSKNPFFPPRKRDQADKLRHLAAWSVSHSKAQEFFSRRKSHIKLLIKIPLLIIRLPVKLVHHIHVQVSDQITVLALIENRLDIQKKIMPVTDKFFVISKIRSIYPFPDLDLTAAGLFALVDLKDVFKTTVLIVSSQRERQAEADPEHCGWSIFRCHSEIRIVPLPLSS